MRQFLVPLSLFGAILTGCQKPATDGVSDAVVQLPIVAGRPGVAYFTLKGGAQDNRLLEVTSPQIIRIELHESLMKDGMMTMAPLEGGVAVPAGGSVKFEPGGKHAMLYDINPKAVAGSKLTLTFAYANGRKIETMAEVKAAGDAAEHQH